MEQIFIPVVLGTAREGRESEAVAKFVFGEFQKHEGLTTELVDVGDHLRNRTLPPYGKGGADEVGTPWKETMSRADGILIVSPEYNRGYPGELKMLLDSLYKEYRRKPMGLIGISDGPWGGSRAVEQLKLVAAGLSMVAVPTTVHTPFADKLFDEDGHITDEKYGERSIFQ